MLHPYFRRPKRVGWGRTWERRAWDMAWQKPIGYLIWRELRYYGRKLKTFIGHSARNPTDHGRFYKGTETWARQT